MTKTNEATNRLAELATSVAQLATHTADSAVAAHQRRAECFMAVGTGLMAVATPKWPTTLKELEARNKIRTIRDAEVALDVKVTVPEGAKQTPGSVFEAKYAHFDLDTNKATFELVLTAKANSVVGAAELRLTGAQLQQLTFFSIMSPGKFENALTTLFTTLKTELTGVRTILEDEQP